jgi:eukaryotic-like serine/threonine-protein kinase
MALAAHRLWTATFMLSLRHGNAVIPGDPQGFALAGRVIAGKYRIDRKLGAGGMGYVVAATHLQLGKRVALKFLHADRVSVPQSVERFLREARAAAGLRSEHVAQVLDVGVDSGAPFIVLEYLEGCDLGELRRRRASLPPAEAASFVMQASLGVAEAHDVGIIHRDIKPTNLFVATRADGSTIVKVLDFGISKWRDDPALRTPDAAAESLTGEGEFVGSPQYMSPEQITWSRDVDARTDVWSLGVVLYELLTGRLPFSAQDHAEGFRRILTWTPPEPTDLRPEVPPGLSAVVIASLAKDPALRFVNARELSRALRPFAEEGLETSDPPGRPERVPPSTVTLEGTTKQEGVVARSPRRSMRVAVISAAGIAWIGLVAAVVRPFIAPRSQPAAASGWVAPGAVAAPSEPARLQSDASAVAASVSSSIPEPMEPPSGRAPAGSAHTLPPPNQRPPTTRAPRGRAAASDDDLYEQRQ